MTIDQLKLMWKEIQTDALKDYYTFLRFESVSTDPKYKTHVKECSEWLVDYINKIGLKTEIISFDSRQFYKELKIGTAAPSKEQLETIQHHFIHHLSIDKEYTVGDFKKEASRIGIINQFPQH